MTQDRVLLNDARIAQAATSGLAADGWAAMTPSAVARRAGMSQRAVQTRFPTRHEVGAGAWLSHAGPTLQSALADALASSGLLDSPGSETSFIASMERVARPDTNLLAAAELLVLSMFEPAVSEVVEETLGSVVREWCTPVAGRLTRATAARRASVLILALGLLAAGRRPGAASLDLAGDLAAMHEALHTDASPTRLPADRPLHALEPTPFDTGDPVLDALLVATLDRVGHLGFDAATSMVIARAAGHSETPIFTRYPTKLALFIDAAARQQSIAFRANEAFTERIQATHGRAIAEAVNMREFMHPDLALKRAIYAETIRISWHTTELRDRQEAEIAAFIDEMHHAHPDWPDGTNAARAHVAYATAIGYALLPILAPDAWKLPYDVITRPLEGEL